MVIWHSCFDSCQLTRKSNVIKLMWTLIFTKPAWQRSPCLRDTAAVVGDSTRPRAIPLFMLTMKKQKLGFYNFFAWLSSVSPISKDMGFRSPPFGPEELRYHIPCRLVLWTTLPSYIPKQIYKVWVRHNGADQFVKNHRALEIKKINKWRVGTGEKATFPLTWCKLVKSFPCMM